MPKPSQYNLSTNVTDDDWAIMVKNNVTYKVRMSRIKEYMTPPVPSVGSYYKTEYSTRLHSAYAHTDNKWYDIYTPVTVVMSIDFVSDKYIHIKRHGKYWDNSPDHSSSSLIKEYSYMDSFRYGTVTPDNFGIYVNGGAWQPGGIFKDGTLSVFAEFKHYASDTLWQVKPINNDGSVIRTENVTIPGNSIVFPVAADYFYSNDMTLKGAATWEAMNMQDNAWMTAEETCTLMNDPTQRWNTSINDCEKYTESIQAVPVFDDVKLATYWYAMNLDTGNLKFLGGSEPWVDGSAQLTTGPDDQKDATRAGYCFAEALTFNEPNSKHPLAPVGSSRSLFTNMSNAYVIFSNGNFNEPSSIPVPSNDEYTLSTTGTRDSGTFPYMQDGVDVPTTGSWVTESGAATADIAQLIASTSNSYDAADAGELMTTHHQMYSNTVPTTILSPWDIVWNPGNGNVIPPGPDNSPVRSQSGMPVFQNQKKLNSWGLLLRRFRTDSDSPFSFNPPPGYADNYTVTKPTQLTTASSSYYLHGYQATGAINITADPYWQGIISSSSTPQGNVLPAFAANGEAIIDNTIHGGTAWSVTRLDQL